MNAIVTALFLLWVAGVSLATIAMGFDSLRTELNRIARALENKEAK